MAACIPYPLSDSKHLALDTRAPIVQPGPVPRYVFIQPLRRRTLPRQHGHQLAMLPRLGPQFTHATAKINVTSLFLEARPNATNLRAFIHRLYNFTGGHEKFGNPSLSGSALA